MNRSWSRLRRALAVVLVVALAAAPRAQAAAADFDDAGAAFAAGDYARALGLFERARDAGGERPAVDYNIGVCQYKLGDYAAAAASFAALAARFPAMRELAEYNRALSLAALGKRREAQAALEVARQSRDPKIVGLAEAMLARLSSPASASRGRPWNGLVDFALGHDDNVALLDELSLPVGESAGSRLREIETVASRSFASTVPFRLDVSGYFVRYPEAGEYDQDFLDVGGEFAWRAGGWRIGAGPQWSQSTLGGADFERRLGLDVAVLRDLGPRTRLEARFVYDSVDALDSQFDFVAGTRRQWRFAVDVAAGVGRLGVFLDAESNDRQAASVSSDRRRVALDYRRRLASKWSLDGRVAYRSSRFAELSVPREEDLTDVEVTGRRDFGGGWLLEARYRHSRNGSTAAGFSYTAGRIGLGVSKEF